MRQQLIILFLLLLFSLLLRLPATAEEPEVEARRLLNALGCKGCHSFEGDGGSLAPALDRIGSRLSREQIAKHLVAHTENRQQSTMPSYNSTAADKLKILSDFLYKHQ